MKRLNALLYTSPAPEIPTYRIFARHLHINRYIVLRPRQLDVVIFNLADDTLINTIHSTITEGFTQHPIELTIPTIAPPAHVLNPHDTTTLNPETPEPVITPLVYHFTRDNMTHAIHRRTNDEYCLHVYPA